ncbi:hypothetical protein ACFJIX_07045 [Roseateles sp. UC29_93]|jgi:hypothetical protein|uniref:hypothetical protein n=1 Tax=Roseateles sp. UC29_93 TaxID=3350177 RepID=UPI003670FE3E
MKQPEPIAQQTTTGASVVYLDEARARRESAIRHAIYAAIRDSVRHIDITRGRRMAEARERATYTC